MSINRRTAIKNLLILAPVPYAGLPDFLTRVQPLSDHNGQGNTGMHYIYTVLLHPREYPDDGRRFVQPPDWQTFGNTTQFTSLRKFRIVGNRIVHYQEDLDIYTKVYDLGDVIWPFHDFLSAGNLPVFIDELKKRGLFLFDIWGYVPGSGPGEWEQYKLSPGISRLFASKLGDHWLGMDNGEQDGRYIGGFAAQMYPTAADRVQQYLNFQQHFEQITDDLGNKIATLVSLNYGHYFLKEGVYTLIGAETAQALPNGQVFYSFIRGAGKQYGVPWFGNASVYNRWGHKTYDTEGSDYGPTKGTSLSLMKRLMYSHILYNSMIVGFEADQLYAGKIKTAKGANGEEDALTPIGRIQRSAVRWVRETGQPGVMHTPVALMLDFFAGWTFPRHLYSSDIYRVWGNLPYQPGDYLTDAVLNLIYPGYQNASYYQDETGFISATPYGDIADCILSDAEGWLLERYPLLVIAGELSGGMELRDKLQNYVAAGGYLIITAGNLVKFTGGLGGVKAGDERKHSAADQVINMGKEKLTEGVPFDFYPLSFPADADLLATTANAPVAIRTRYGKGQMTVLASAFGISSRNAVPEADKIKSDENAPLPKPYPILKHVQAILDAAFRTQMLFDIGGELSLITCCRGGGKYMLGIANNSWQEQPLKITSCCGHIASMEESVLDQSERTATGYTPEGINAAQLGTGGKDAIAGGEIRIFLLQVQEEKVEVTPHEVPPARPKNRFLPVRNIRQIKAAILSRPTFFEHFNGVVVDWKYLSDKTVSTLHQEAGWINRQKLSIIIDFSSGVDLFPALRLIDNLHADYVASMAKIGDVIEKMGIVKAKELIMPLHRFPENNFTRQQSWASFAATFTRLCKKAAQTGINVNLRMRAEAPPYSLEEAIGFIERVGAPNLKLAVGTALLLTGKEDVEKAAALIKDKKGLLLVSGVEQDIEGRYWNYNLPVFHEKKIPELIKMININPGVPVVLDAVYRNRDEEYQDACTLDELSEKI